MLKSDFVPAVLLDLRKFCVENELNSTAARIDAVIDVYRKEQVLVLSKLEFSKPAAQPVRYGRVDSFYRPMKFWKAERNQIP